MKETTNASTEAAGSSGTGSSSSATNHTVRRRPNSGSSIRPSRNAAQRNHSNTGGGNSSNSSSSIRNPNGTTLIDSRNTTATANTQSTTRVSFADDTNTGSHQYNVNVNDDDDRMTLVVTNPEEEESLVRHETPNDDDGDVSEFMTHDDTSQQQQDMTTAVIVTQLSQENDMILPSPPTKPTAPTTTTTTSLIKKRPWRRPPSSSTTASSPNKKVRTIPPNDTPSMSQTTTDIHDVGGNGDDEEETLVSVRTTNAVVVASTASDVASAMSTTTTTNNSTNWNKAVPVPPTPIVAAPNNNNGSSSSRNNSLTCPNCGSHAIEQHEASGATICTECGVVVEENAIVSSIEFVEGAGGSSNMVGQYVSATSSKAYSTGGGGGGGNIRGGGRYGFSRDSRETTLANGRRRIQELASRLRLSSHYVDGAHRLFTVAVERNFVQGRRTSHVVAACLYIACRQEKSQHMLIDFSDALQVNVYTLGTCFLKFRRLLGLKLEIIDPALYVYRFAAHLDLDDRANAVSLTSLRLVARMKRDWIVAGRRPAGICAAALLIAARAHGFDKHCADVTRILRVCGMTVTNRIREFERTPTAHLSLEQFQTIDFEAEADPPIYTKNKIREARAKAIQEGNVQLLSSGVLDDDGKRGSRWRNTAKKQKQPSERSVKFQELYQSLDKKLNNDDNNDADDDDDIESNEMEIVNVDKTTADSDQLVVHDMNTKLGTDGEASTTLVQWKDAYPKNRGRDMIMPHEATDEEQLPATAPTEAKLSLSDWKQSLPNEIDLEIEDFFRTSKEEKEKEAIFNKINKDYIAQQERKENERLDMEAATKDQDVDDLAQAAGQARYKDVVGRNTNATSASGGTYKSKRHRDGVGDQNNNANPTTEEQLRAAVASRKVSRKINYDALSSIFDDDGSFATSKLSGDGLDDYGNNYNEEEGDHKDLSHNKSDIDMDDDVMI